MSQNPYTNNYYSATVRRWVDGDTVDLDVDLGQRVVKRDRYRLLGLDAPETAMRRGVTEDEKVRGLALKAEIAVMLPAGSQVLIQTTKAGKYGRWLVVVHARQDVFPDPVPTASVANKDMPYCHLNDWLVATGRAREYLL